MNDDTLWLQVPAAIASRGLLRIAKLQHTNITKPLDLLDNIVHITNRLAVLQNQEHLCINKTHITIFVADHGVVIENTFKTNKLITAEILNNVIHSDASLNILARKLNAKLEILNLGTVNNLESISGVTNLILGPGTSNLSHEPAMTREQLARAINAGRQTAQRIKLSGSQLYIGGEINIGHPIAATAINCALLDIPAEQLLDNSTHHREIILNLIRNALTHHKEHLTSPLEILRLLGSFEIAALTGSYLCCAHIGLPVFINGFVSSVAALITIRLCPDAKQWFLFSHTSETSQYKIMCEILHIENVITTNNPVTIFPTQPSEHIRH